MEALLTLTGFIIGVISTLLFIYIQSKETLKQTLYKEKIDTYKQLLILFNFVYMELYIRSEKESLSSKDIGQKLLDFRYYLINNAFLLKPDIFFICDDFYKKSIKSISDNKFNSLLDENHLLKLNNEISIDLGINILHKELLDLYKGFPYFKFGFDKPQNNT